jgi:hypothetical protein
MAITARSVGGLDVVDEMMKLYMVFFKIGEGGKGIEKNKVIERLLCVFLSKCLCA